MLNKKQILKIESSLGYSFKNKDLLLQAFTHSSYGKLMNIPYNERLEFLGDSVLQLVTTKYLFNNFDLQEGSLSKIRSFVVSTKNLSKAINDLKLIDYLQYAKSNIKNLSASIKANLFEAILGAIYLESDFEVCYDFVLEKLHYSKKLFEALTIDTKDYKTTLQELIQVDKDNKLEYLIIKKEGPPHNPEFTARVLLNGKIMGESKGKTKKEAENNSAHLAIKKLS